MSDGGWRLVTAPRPDIFPDSPRQIGRNCQTLENNLQLPNWFTFGEMKIIVT